SIPLPTYTGPSDWRTDTILHSLDNIIHRMQSAEAVAEAAGTPTTTMTAPLHHLYLPYYHPRQWPLPPSHSTAVITAAFLSASVEQMWPGMNGNLESNDGVPAGGRMRTTLAMSVGIDHW
ncbi:hypothetical protein GYMLUDRAFT_174268, partial [Collybiopsis luxurians FD-317 M1]